MYEFILKKKWGEKLMDYIIKKKHTINVIIVLTCLILLLTSFSLAANATTLEAYQKFDHSAWSANYGLKTFTYRVSYMASQSSTSTEKQVSGHDVYSYKCTTDAIWSPELGNGTVMLQNIYMQDSSTGNLYSYLSGSSFVNGSYFSRLVCGGMNFLAKKCSNTQSSSNARTYTNRVLTYFYVGDGWAPSSWTGDYAWTQSY